MKRIFFLRFCSDLMNIWLIRQGKPKNIHLISSTFTNLPPVNNSFKYLAIKTVKFALAIQGQIILQNTEGLGRGWSHKGHRTVDNGSACAWSRAKYFYTVWDEARLTSYGYRLNYFLKPVSQSLLHPGLASFDRFSILRQPYSWPK